MHFKSNNLEWPDFKLKICSYNIQKQSWQYSRLTGVTTKALKYYKRKNILKPTWIDPESGYRYYRLQQIYQLNLIGLFTNLDMRLNQFCNYIDEDYQHVDYSKILEAGKSITKERIQTLEDKMRYTDYLENNTRHLNYKNNISTRPVWLLPCKGIPNKNNIEKAVKKNTTWWYKQIASFYENEKNFFILMNEDELYVLPKKDFVIGDVDEFRQYIETKICTKVML